MRVGLVTVELKRPLVRRLQVEHEPGDQDGR